MEAYLEKKMRLLEKRLNETKELLKQSYEDSEQFLRNRNADMKIARNAALEEAAKMVESFYGSPDFITITCVANKIRSMKEA